ncbi:putative glycolipid-binding domain-containing protein [Nocardia sp. CDC159]|uniref:Glycolipid-binding domain-containing protein n=1 Tax=Nocardia pulmonis TaxID=2951408 RepID=A0A9X2IYF4_9NOCA|nr:MULTISPECIES: putative glycolipid-binding domain-containing protein [Nocardia]MCM6773861.1 putative glycolipid-binding domain-containing protein [Nocardia pulmonis]MCM6786748.1 putative glycolipid-binding domain-containing protein [Nocardia sp. CDC159]
MRTFVWEGVDEPRMEIVHADGMDRAHGTQLGLVYELRWWLDGSALTVDAGAGPVRHELDGADFFDLQHSAFFNSLPVLRDGLLSTTQTRDYTMRFVTVPGTTAYLAPQRYEAGGDGTVRFISGDYRARIEFDRDGFVVLYEDYLRRLHP